MIISELRNYGSPILKIQIRKNANVALRTSATDSVVRSNEEVLSKTADVRHWYLAMMVSLTIDAQYSLAAYMGLAILWLPSPYMSLYICKYCI
jgi:hypothetical protein